ncbi:MAG TPA: choice-of-anchor Q domain-containing protein [Chitinophagales bacterium]|nr:choice-of-anchor Q domain-containing protein [Chitinophagales bacterium]
MTAMRSNFSAVLILCITAIIFSSCRKDTFTTDGADKLSFSSDTLTFDTVFTTLGSTTLYFTVHNPHNQKISISDIHVAGGESSIFRLNIDGQQVNEATNVEIPANDSIYIFVAVTVDPTDENNPFVMYDSVLFETNGNLQAVTLQAWGQNANFIYGEVIGTQTWTPEKPYVIIHSILVDSDKVLTIQPGCRIYMHADSRFYVQGTLKVMGQVNDSVIFRGDRLESYYVDDPGNWEGIHLLRSSHDNEINYAVIKEAIVGIRVDSLKETAAPKLTMRNSQIRFTLSSGLLAITSDVYAENCLIQGCGEWNVQLEFGGNYQFENCTFANNSSILINHQSPVARLSNYFAYKDEQGMDQVLLADLNAAFRNCIVYGSLENELDLDPSENAEFNFTFDHCAMKVNEDVDTTVASFVDCIFNQDPVFVDPFDHDDYHLAEGSPCIDAGTANGIAIDLDGKPRNDGKTDIGCYEFQP